MQSDKIERISCGSSVSCHKFLICSRTTSVGGMLNSAILSTYACASGKIGTWGTQLPAQPSFHIWRRWGMIAVNMSVRCRNKGLRGDLSALTTNLSLSICALHVGKKGGIREVSQKSASSICPSNPNARYIKCPPPYHQPQCT